MVCSLLPVRLIAMRVEATRTTAALTGAWTVLGMGSLEIWEKGHPLDVMTHNIVFLAMGTVFFFVPVFLFVIGFQKMYGLKDYFSRDYWVNFGEVGIRMLCWFLGAAAFGTPTMALLQWLFAS